MLELLAIFFNEGYKGKEWGADAKLQIVREFVVEVCFTDKLNVDVEIVTCVQVRQNYPSNIEAIGKQSLIGEVG